MSDAEKALGRELERRRINRALALDVSASDPVYKIGFEDGKKGVPMSGAMRDPKRVGVNDINNYEAGYRKGQSGKGAKDEERPLASIIEKPAEDARYSKDDQRRLMIGWESGKQAKAKGQTLEQAVGNAPAGSAAGQARAAGWKGESIDWWFN